LHRHYGLDIEDLHLLRPHWTILLLLLLLHHLHVWSVMSDK